MSKLSRRPIERILRDEGGNSLLELAVALPVLLTLGMYGIELANMKITDMQMSQIAMSVADAASRLGQTDNSSVTPSVQYTDVDSVMFGAMKQGASIGLQANGRIILSSLQRDSSTGRQYIAWQKCRGSLAKSSAYGPTNYGKTGTVLPYMGAAPGIQAQNGTAVMFVEVYYQYKPLFGTMFVKPLRIAQEAAFQVRDDRDYTNGVVGTGSSECS